MVATPSTMLPLGTQAPDFILPDTRNDLDFDFAEVRHRQAYLVCFICNHCPYVIHLLDSLTSQLNKWTTEDICVLAICSNDPVKYPADRPSEMKKLAADNNFSFPYLHDANQRVAKLYTASCTPDFFLFDREKKLFYRGQYDSSRPGNGVAVTGKDLSFAVEKLLSGQTPPENQIPSLGCNVKWIAGNEPSYFKS